MVGEQRRGPDRGGDGQGDALGERSGETGERRPQSAADREDGDDRRERELPAGVGGDQGIEGEGDRGGEQEGVPARGRAPGPERHEPRRSHHPGPLEGGTRSGQRHVDRDQHEHRGRAGARSGARGHQERQRERAQQHHVLAGDRHDVGEAGAAKVLSHRLGDAFVLPEDHPPGERRAGWRETGGDPGLGAPAGGVDGSERAAAPPAGGSQPVEAQLDGDPPAAQVGRPVEVRSGFRPGTAKAAGDLEFQPRPRSSRPALIAVGVGHDPLTGAAPVGDLERRA